MKLHWSPRSPFVRKVMVFAHECGLADRIECIRTVAATTKPHNELMKDNPLSKIPTLIRDDDVPLYNSSVICEYLDNLHDGPKLFPAEFEPRMTALRRQALGDGFLDLLVLWRGELMRPPAQQSKAHLGSFAERRAAVLGKLEEEAGALAHDPLSVGHIAIGCALSYIDFRFAGDAWRDNYLRIAQWHAVFAARPSMRATEPVDNS